MKTLWILSIVALAGCADDAGEKADVSDSDTDTDTDTDTDSDVDADTDTDTFTYTHTGYNAGTPAGYVLGVGAADWTSTTYDGVYTFLVVGTAGGMCSITYEEDLDSTVTVDGSLCVNPEGVPCAFAFATVRHDGVEDADSDCAQFGFDVSVMESQRTTGFVDSYPVQYGGQTYEYGPLKLFYYNGTYGTNVYQGWYVDFPAFYGSLYGPAYFGLPETELSASDVIWSDYFGSF